MIDPRTAWRTEGCDLVVERRFAAPRALVFAAWTDPVHLARWWGPRVFTSPGAAVDLRPGGTWSVVMRGPDGADLPLRGRIEEVVPPERLVITMLTADHPPAWHAAVAAFTSDDPGAILETIPTFVTFEEVDGGTLVRVVQRFASERFARGIVELGSAVGWSESFDKLDDVLDDAPVGPDQIVVSRRYGAPRALVFEAWTRAEHVDAWWGPDGFATTTASMDVRPGGAWIFTMRHAEHGTFPNRVRYREVVVPERLVYDHDAGEDGDPRAFLVRVRFREVDGGTEVVMRSTFSSVEACEAVKRFGAVEGGRQTLARLDGWLAARG